MPFSLYPTTSGGSGGGVTRSGNTVDSHLVIWDGNDADSIKDGGIAPKILEADFDNSVTGSQNLITITGTVNITIAYDATSSVLTIANNNAIGGIGYRLNYINKVSTATGSPSQSDESPSDQPGGFIFLAAGTVTFLGGNAPITNINDRQDIIIQVNSNLLSPSTYNFNLTLFRNWAGVTIDGKYRFSNLP